LYSCFFTAIIHTQSVLQSGKSSTYPPFIILTKGGNPIESINYLSSDILAPEINILRERGIAEGKAECILETLSDYGKVPIGIQEKILRQTRHTQLERWFTLARQVRSVEEFINRM